MVTGGCLLDTSTTIWALADPDRLSAAAKKAMRGKPLVVSVVIYWEVVINPKKRLLDIPDPAELVVEGDRIFGRLDIVDSSESHNRACRPSRST